MFTFFRKAVNRHGRAVRPYILVGLEKAMQEETDAEKVEAIRKVVESMALSEGYRSLEDMVEDL